MLNDDKLKLATSIPRQIEILKERGLVIDSVKSAETLLSRIHYYRFSAYSLGLRDHNIFHQGVTFDQIYRIYKFDEQLRKLFFAIIEPIEIKLRATMSNHLALKYGNICHKDGCIFTDKQLHVDFLAKHDESVKRMKDLAFVKHHIDVYKDLPIWASVEIWSFGMASRFYGNLLAEDQKAIASCFGVDQFYFTGWLECFCYIRNICAHNGRLYNRVIVKRPKLYREDLCYNNKKIFPIILVLKRLNQGRGAAWRIFTDELIKLVNKYTSDINLAFIGFPKNWHDLLN